MNPMLTITHEVQSALADRRPVVALESTIISHGMPYPKNVEMATSVEDIIRSEGAVPATIAVLDGAPCIGLTPAQLEHLATAKDVMKVSVRDLPYVAATKHPGATTVAATMRIAALAGIRIFATGGIGGVHRGAQTTFDISADLTEMSTTSVAVVSAGVKSILDIGLTLEVLETLGVPVIVHGSDEFPSFYSRSSGHRSPLRADDPAAIAAMLHAKWSLGLEGGVSIANPIPAESEIPADQISVIIDAALAEAQASGVTGKDVTPFLLARIVDLTGGASLTANIALVKHNARVAARIAVAYQDLQG